MSNEIPVECSLCGRDGGPSIGCGTCHGNAQAQPAALTLSQLRSKPNIQTERYGPNAEVGPKSIRLPGSQN